MIPLSLAEIAAIVGGAVDGAVDGGRTTLVIGPAFLDSRTPEPAGLFVAVDGERVDGHEYAAAAVDGGAAAVLGSRPTGVPTVVVPDVQAALHRLAAEALVRLRQANPDLRVAAVTGSQGKTSVKDMLAAILSDAAPTVATYQSFNNELGLPLTVLRATPETTYLVLEMGARGVGHIADLCRTAPPDVSAVLNVGLAHVGEFGSQAAIARAKGEIIEALGPDGVAVLNHDDPLVAAMAPRTRGRVTSFGRGPGASVRLTAVDVDDLGRPTFDLHADDAQVHVRLRLLGEHQAVNAAAAAAVALALGLSLDAIGASLERIEVLSPWRMELRERADGLVVINDAYNANPHSMRAALETLSGIGRRTGRRTVAVLGEMRELGAASAEEHRALGRLVRDLEIDRLVVVGEGAREITSGNESAQFHGSVPEALAAVRKNVRGSEVVLVKASRAAGLEQVAQGLLTDSGDNSEEGDA
ncbi:UDP-N-acetylmuramoyl-tripeptide--D-alanyl-D-alanine ligase [Nocardioides pocheonensis]|uniref:UDP-N-acetylmuramoyl-tripeptide--D-alanyl-D-alanine ligase n=1 Tax=Nocardioides pocheonensis TaxID=661485 RepID=A0A3N0GUW5_9ACTN|nr:UDP-N-acetylmuramoyl-tripeptide--D-alanyl-D-alanine ligase [Nocardioides pocheonensis]RNM15958.1 UDP-N-acetylmuramoyl-tripeptide--D-alanyl-D-alanine ligase [Nocardioides pocheonensis]